MNGTLPEDEEDVIPKIEYAAPSPGIKPLYLFADSQLLFWQQDDGELFLRSVRALLPQAPLAVYVGASNGDDPAYYSIFESAMEQVGISERRMIPAELSAEDFESVERAHLILLAGGDVERGWRVFEDNGLKRIVARRYNEGALLIGISAGAVQLGLAGWSAKGKMISTFRIIPHVIGAHEESQSWEPLKQLVRHFGEHTRGYGIPAGGGLVYHVDHSVQPIRRPLYEFQLRRKDVQQHLLLPGEAPSPEPEEEPREEPNGDVLVIN